MSRSSGSGGGVMTSHQPPLVYGRLPPMPHRHAAEHTRREGQAPPPGGSPFLEAQRTEASGGLCFTTDATGPPSFNIYFLLT